jgi:SET domain-containing protein 6
MIRLIWEFREQKYPDVFKRNASLSVQPFSLEHFHIQGSRILSRSFSVPSSRAGRKKHGRQEAGAGDTSMQTDGDVSMHTDEGDKTLDLGDQTLETVNGENEDEPEEEEDEEDDEDAEEEVMVPVADMLNAAYERDNVGCELLEYEKSDISAQQKRITGKVIPRGRLFEDGHH